MISLFVCLMDGFGLMDDCVDWRKDGFVIRWLVVWMDGGMVGLVIGWMND